MWQKRAHRVILFAIEGPARPWWAAPAVFGFACALAGLLPQAMEIVACLGLVAFVWMLTRASQLAHYRYLARTATSASCPQCGYSMSGIATATCPECGLRVPEHLHWLKRRAGVSNPWDIQVSPGSSSPGHISGIGPVFAVVLGAVSGGCALWAISSMLRMLILGGW